MLHVAVMDYIRNHPLYPRTVRRDSGQRRTLSRRLFDIHRLMPIEGLTFAGADEAPLDGGNEASDDVPIFDIRRQQEFHFDASSRCPHCTAWIDREFEVVVLWA